MWTTLTKFKNLNLKTVVYFIVVSLVLLSGFLLRTEALQLTKEKPLDPDAITYIAISEQMKSYYDTSTREPFYVWWVRLITQGNDKVSSLRMGTIFLSMVFLVVAASTWGRKMPYVASLTFIIFLSFNHYLISSSTRGLRTEMQLIFVTLLTYFTLMKVTPYHKIIFTNGLLISIIFSLSIITHFSFVPVGIVLMGFWAFKNKVNWKYVILMLLLPLVSILPFLFHNYLEYKDPLYFYNVYAPWFRNYEFLEYQTIGCNDCPTVSEYWKNGYGGKFITMSEYYWNVHGPVKVAKRTTRGLFYLYTYQGVVKYLSGLNTSRIPALFILTVFAGALYLTLKGSPIILLPALIANLSAFFIPINMDPRLYANTIPFMGIMFAYGTWLLYKASRQLVVRNDK